MTCARAEWFPVLQTLGEGVGFGRGILSLSRLDGICLGRTRATLEIPNP